MKILPKDPKEHKTFVILHKGKFLKIDNPSGIKRAVFFTSFSFAIRRGGGINNKIKVRRKRDGWPSIKQEKTASSLKRNFGSCLLYIYRAL